MDKDLFHLHEHYTVDNSEQNLEIEVISDISDTPHNNNNHNKYTKAMPVSSTKGK